MIHIKSKKEIEMMRASGLIAAAALKGVLDAIKPGVSLLALDKIAKDIILNHGATPSFTTVNNYKYATCINVNDGIVHGLPNEYRVKVGDLVSVDLGALYKGFHSDLSYTVEVNTVVETSFLRAGEEALAAGVFACAIGNTVGDIGYAMQKVIESHGYSVSRDLVGHGIGKSLHEDPYIPGYGKRGHGVKIKEGMVFAIEIIYQKGSPDLKYDTDGWTIRTKDGSLSGLFEHTVAVTKDGPILLTV